uniref:RHH domain, CopG/RepA family transcriptional regulator n=1 Tax=Thermococcus sp. IRI48 TaxID=1197734 RepID=L0B8D9_9EURY|nr:ribbon-helix-helix domain-containing protein [Thermococcus sp. IRI48]AFZ84237.1 RHH domain, CopG/RepA family; transcriptional regulator [Thermococcus sp. IRI48]
MSPGSPTLPKKKPKEKKEKAVIVRIPPELVESLDAVVRAGFYKSRNAAIVESIRLNLLLFDGVVSLYFQAQQKIEELKKTGAPVNSFTVFRLMFEMLENAPTTDLLMKEMEARTSQTLSVARRDPELLQQLYEKFREAFDDNKEGSQSEGESAPELTSLPKETASKSLGGDPSKSPGGDPQ